MLDEVRSTEPMPRTTFATRDLVSAIVASEFQAIMTQSEATLGYVRAWYLDLLATALTVDLSNGNVQGALNLIFPQATCPTTYANLRALYTRPGSRAETLFGAGVSVSGADVGAALGK
jgi:hypothetical protein